MKKHKEKTCTFDENDMIVERADSRKYPKKDKMEDIDKEAEYWYTLAYDNPLSKSLKKQVIKLALKSGIRIGEEKRDKH